MSSKSTTLKDLLPSQLSVEDLKTLQGPCQLDIFAFGDAYEKEVKKKGQLIEQRAGQQAIRNQLPTWDMLKRFIYERDGGFCYACEEWVPFEEFQLGHLVDKMMGGTDYPDNLRVMCYQCNHHKPMHATVKEALRWNMVDDFMVVVWTIFRQVSAEMGLTGEEPLTQWQELQFKQRCKARLLEFKRARARLARKVARTQH